MTYIYIYIFKKVILNGWDLQNFFEAQAAKCGQNLKHAQSPKVQENIFSDVFLNAY